MWLKGVVTRWRSTAKIHGPWTETSTPRGTHSVRLASQSDGTEGKNAGLNTRSATLALFVHWHSTGERSPASRDSRDCSTVGESPTSCACSGACLGTCHREDPIVTDRAQGLRRHERAKLGRIAKMAATNRASLPSRSRGRRPSGAGHLLKARSAEEADGVAHCTKAPEAVARTPRSTSCPSA